MGFLTCCTGCCAVLAMLAAMAWQYFMLTPIAFRPEDLTGHRIIVTGGTNGIGRATAEKLAAWNATVVLPVRNVAKGEKVKKEIVGSLPSGSTGSVELQECDLASLDSVRKFAESFLASGASLSALILNAGMMADPSKLEITKDGIEMCYQVNFLAHFLLTRLLTPALVKSAPSRVVHVSSILHYMGTIDEVAYSASSKNAEAATASLANSYSDTKLMQVAFSNYYQKMFGDKGVTSIAIHPGYVMSDLDGNMPLYVEPALRWFREVSARPTLDGAITQVTAATSREITANYGGTYLQDMCMATLCKSGGVPGVTPLGQALDEKKQRWLWETSSQIVGLEP